VRGRTALRTMRRWAALHVGAARAGVFLPQGHGWSLGLILLLSGRESRVTKFQIHLTFLSYFIYPCQAKRTAGKVESKIYLIGFAKNDPDTFHGLKTLLRSLDIGVLGMCSQRNAFISVDLTYSYSTMWASPMRCRHTLWTLLNKRQQHLSDY